VLNTLSAGATVMINDAITYTVQYVTVYSTTVYIGFTTMGSGSISKLTITNTTISFANGVLVGGNLSGGTTKSTVKLFDNQIALGTGAGQSSQGSYSIAIGGQAGNSYQSNFSIAIGYNAGIYNQGTNAIAIGTSAGGSGQHDNSIIISATGTDVPQTTTSGLFIAPVRSDSSPTNIVYYNTISKEMTYGPVPAGGGSGGSASGYFATARPDPLGSSSVSFTLPTQSGPVFASIYFPGNMILNVGPSQWSLAPTIGVTPQSNYISTTPSGSQTVFLQNPGYGPGNITQFVLDASDVSRSVFFSPGMSQGFTGMATVDSPITMNFVPWTTGGYAYGFLSANGVDAWTALQGFVAASNVTTYLDLSLIHI
jgi:hypothetical protein